MAYFTWKSRPIPTYSLIIEWKEDDRTYVLINIKLQMLLKLLLIVPTYIPIDESEKSFRGIPLHRFAYPFSRMPLPTTIQVDRGHMVVIWRPIPRNISYYLLHQKPILQILFNFPIKVISLHCHFLSLGTIPQGCKL